MRTKTSKRKPKVLKLRFCTKTMIAVAISYVFWLGCCELFIQVNTSDRQSVRTFNGFKTPAIALPVSMVGGLLLRQLGK